MKSNALINSDSLKTLERSILVAGSIVLFTSVALLLSTGLTHFQQVEASSKSVLAKQEILTLTETIEKSKRVKYVSNTKKEISMVQASMDRLANENHCELQERNSTDDTVPFMTKYKAGSDEKGWKQMAMSFQVLGSLTNVMTFTRGLAMISTPIELASIEITPISTDGASKISAKVVIQILKQEVVR
jgi:hypothetical protein